MQENETWVVPKGNGQIELILCLILYHHRKRKFQTISGIFKIFTRLPTPPQGQKAHRCTTRGSRFGGIPGPGIRPTKNVLNYNDCFFGLGKSSIAEPNLAKIPVERPIWTKSTKDQSSLVRGGSGFPWGCTTSTLPKFLPRLAALSPWDSTKWEVIG